MNITSKAQATKVKIEKLDYIKTETFSAIKGHSQQRVMFRTPLHVFVGSLYIFLGEMSIKVLCPHFNQVV